MLLPGVMIYAIYSLMGSFMSDRFSTDGAPEASAVAPVKRQIVSKVAVSFRFAFMRHLRYFVDASKT